VNAPVEHDATARRFRLRTPQGGEAWLAYAPIGDDVYDFHYTFVPRTERGQGHGARVVEHAMEHARARGWRVRASCGFVRGWLEAHPDYRDALSESTR